ncbi:uncharacterized protein F4812DRAFT_457009 [Daldinia caldariorum]|uniref:uncharacterized protein n=1 Tax=Daldinia caldariorum TaxID=326644 RepID=UPI0020072B6B|nr:uncharacterized protein F4812DRAFT_457009 [Daldinia caldariorum]KAI1469609.1 hypothetical protein F4812DRAFT_457009 [Daldinia caldariorum]
MTLVALEQIAITLSSTSCAIGSRQRLALIKQKRFGHLFKLPVRDGKQNRHRGRIIFGEVNDPIVSIFALIGPPFCETSVQHTVEDWRHARKRPRTYGEDNGCRIAVLSDSKSDVTSTIKSIS